MNWKILIWFWSLAVASRGESGESSAEPESGDESDTLSNANNLFMFPNFLQFQDVPVQSDSSGLQDNEFHNFLGKFVILPEDEEANMLENSFDLSHRLEDPHSRTKVTYSDDSTSANVHKSHESTSKSAQFQRTGVNNSSSGLKDQHLGSDGSTASLGNMSAGASSNGSTRQKSSDNSDVKVWHAADGTKIIQGMPPTLPPTLPPTKEEATAPVPTEKPTEKSADDVEDSGPKPTIKTVLMDGTIITQQNTGITEGNGTIEPSWKFIPDEYVPWFSDDSGQKNMAGYKFRNRPGEKEKQKLIKEQLVNAVKENNPSYKFKSEEKMLKDLEESHQNGTKPNQVGNEDESRLKASVAMETTNSHRDDTILYDVRPLKPRHFKAAQVETGQKRGTKHRNHKETFTVPVENRKTKKVKKHKRKKGKFLLSVKKSSTNLEMMPLPDFGNTTEINAGNSESDLRSALQSLIFKNEPGVVEKKQNFAYISQCGLYTEPQNVSQIQHAWATKTYSPYFYLYEKPKNYEQCKPSPWMNGTDMRGNVFISFEVKSIHGSNMENNAKICQKYCCREPRCAAWVMRKQNAATANCPKGSYCCWLKSAVPKREPNEDATSGIIQRERYRHPPTGMRSAVPLGGLGTGSFELRADGTFHEWTVENQSPGGAAKLSKTALDLMLLAVRIELDGKHKSAVLRTHPPHGFDGVEKMSYYGSFPVSKLGFELLPFNDIELSLYAHSVFKPRDASASTVPAVTFSLDIVNPTNEDAVISFMFNLPLGYNDDTIRRGGNYAEVAYTRLVKAEDCMNACAKQSKCMSWTTNGPFSCLLKDNMPLNSYEFGIISGLKGMWSATNDTLTFKRPGFYAQSGETSLRVVGNGKDDEIRFITTNHPDKMWKKFKKNGLFGNSSVNATALHGAALIKARVPAGKSRTLPIILSWYYPNRDIADERVGNYYTKMFESSQDVASYVSTHLTEQVQDIAKYQSSISPPQSIFPKGSKPAKSCDPYINGTNVLPECLQDLLLNSLSFWRSGMWLENGRWRQWEAFDCVNLDPVHVDFHRFLPYIIFYPELAKRVMRSWANHQLTHGMIQESLSQGCLEEATRDGTAGGRNMADVNVAFVVQTYMIYMWTNDTLFFDEMYPVAIRALIWLIKEASHGTDLPYRKPDTYDLFELDKYDHCAYNSILLKLALRAGEEMALLRHDFEKLEEIGKAYDKAHIRLEIEMWDDKDGFYHTWFDAEWGSPSWIMSDTFYGQVWAYTLGLGDLVDRKKLKSHLLKERERNDTPFGLKAVSKSDSEKVTQEDTSVILGEEPGCKSLENITKYESIWMTASTDWSVLMVHLDMAPKIALHQAEKSLDHYRTTLKDQWNIHGLTSSEHYGLDGLPWATSHYTFHLMLWHLPLALSGQQYNAPNASLSFAPKFDVPYWLSFYTPVALGSIQAQLTKNSTEIMYKFTVTSGEIHLRHLSISGSKYGSGEVDVVEGQSLQWSAPNRSEKKNVQALLAELKR